MTSATADNGRFLPEIPDASPDLPAWVPVPARQYLAHVSAGHSLRSIARAAGEPPSTVSRRVRRLERRRDDPLLDEALTALGPLVKRRNDPQPKAEEPAHMSAPFRSPLGDEGTIAREARRILRRLCETDAVLAVAQDMDKAVVLRPGPGGEQTRTAVVDRKVAQAFAVKDWISCRAAGRIARYTITAAGKAALRRLIDEDRRRRQSELGFAEATTPFQAQHAIWGEAQVAEPGGKSRKLRVNLAESPLAVLARRTGSDGKPFLTPDLVQAGERLREDFERAQMGPRVGQNWDRFLTAGDRGGFLNDSGLAEGPRAARARVSDALDDLGPGLADVVLRVCCFLEGLESAEKRLGWSARSGKVVLKIGLQRLLRHYQDRYGFVPALRG
jgi:DNA-binding MarR family transcriptional regulator